MFIKNNFYRKFQNNTSTVKNIVNTRNVCSLLPPRMFQEQAQIEIHPAELKSSAWFNNNYIA